MEKPFTLQTEELKENLIKIINESKLPPVLLEYIMKDLYNEIHILSCNQLIQDKQSYKSIDKKPKEQKEGRK